MSDTHFTSSIDGSAGRAHDIARSNELLLTGANGLAEQLAAFATMMFDIAHHVRGARQTTTANVGQAEPGSETERNLMALAVQLHNLDCLLQNQTSLLARLADEARQTREAGAAVH